MENDVLFKLEFRLVAVGWQLWISLMVRGVLLSLVVGDGLFKLAVGLLIWMELLVRVSAGGWLQDGALRCVFARRWRIYCMMMVGGFHWFDGVSCRVVCLAVRWQLWRSLMVESVFLSLVVDDGLFLLALWRSVLVDGRLFDGMGWCMLVSL